MKKIFIAAILLASGMAYADIQWQIVGGKQAVLKIHSFTIQDQKLWINTSDSMSYIISNDVIKSTGLSMKELLDLLKEYDNSKDQVLYFNGEKESQGTFNVKSIGALVVYPKK